MNDNAHFTLAAAKPAGQFLELGSGTGLSTVWLLDGIDAQSQLLTMDHDSALHSCAEIIGRVVALFILLAFRATQDNSNLNSTF